MSNFVFWDIQSLQDIVLKVNGHSINPTYKAIDMKNYSTSYSTTLDDTGVQVVIYTGTIAPTLDFGSYISTAVIVELFGGRPHRPTIK